ncbi:MAG: hypothetical protein KC588_17400, partial [Nitrospira sp.]|nr:hypothetical protein [Nitrospira sp.]
GGAILGALAERTYAKSQETEDSNRICWVPAFLDRQTRDALLRYLAVTHCGRGRGDYTDPREFPLFWREATEEILQQTKDALHQAWILAKKPPIHKNPNEAEAFLVPILTTMGRQILLKFYPEAKNWLKNAPL